MKPEIKEKWVKELRSGNYKQGYGRLRSKTNKFCCLGVLCNIHAQEHLEVARQQTSQNKYLGEELFLPDAVAHWSGMFGYGGAMVTINKRLDTLSNHNDIGRRTFEEIADAIEKQL